MNLILALSPTSISHFCHYDLNYLDKSVFMAHTCFSMYMLGLDEFVR